MATAQHPKCTCPPVTVPAPAKNTPKDPVIHFVGPCPPVGADTLELICAKLFRRTEHSLPYFPILCFYVQCAPGEFIPSPANLERFTLAAVPCYNSGEVLGLMMSMRYSHSYYAAHLRNVRPDHTHASAL